MPEHLPQGLSVPGNLLLAGEYVILEEGGLGLACAVAQHVTCTWSPQTSLSIETLYEDKQASWHPGDKTNPLLDAVGSCLPSYLLSCKYKIVIDSTALSTPDGLKTGLGSSAATTVALIATLLYLHEKRRPSMSRVFALALSAHRHLQGGRGSGYDIACSTYGGLGLFTGGNQPSYFPKQKKLPSYLQLVTTEHPVSTPNAITTWQQWKEDYPQAWQTHITQSQQLVQKLLQNQNPTTFNTLLKEAGRLGKQLGQKLGIWNPENESTKFAPLKAVGAGNELYLAACKQDDPNQIKISTQGVTWH